MARSAYYRRSSELAPAAPYTGFVDFLGRCPRRQSIMGVSREELEATPPPESSSDDEDEDVDEYEHEHEHDYEASEYGHERERSSSPSVSGSASEYEYESESESMSDGKDSSMDDPPRSELDEPLDCTFKKGEAVWIKLQNKWYNGKVLISVQSSKRPKVKLYSVFFRGNVKANAAPIDGTLKPDTPHIRSLLHAEGWI